MTRISFKRKLYARLVRASVFYNNRILGSRDVGLSYSGEQYKKWMFYEPNHRWNIDFAFRYLLGEEQHCKKAYIAWRNENF